MTIPFASALVVWLAAALLAGASGFYRHAPVFAWPLTLWILVASLAVATRSVRGVREWIFQLDLRVLVAFHGVRVVGLYFLLLYSRGELPFAFAVPGGLGDIAVAVLALVVAALNCPRKMTTLWNAFGFVDILGVVFTAARLAFGDRASMSAMESLPLSLLPTFVVPLIVVTHVVIGLRLRSIVVAAR